MLVSISRVGNCVGFPVVLYVSSSSRPFPLRIIPNCCVYRCARHPGATVLLLVDLGSRFAITRASVGLWIACVRQGGWSDVPRFGTGWSDRPLGERSPELESSGVCGALLAMEPHQRCEANCLAIPGVASATPQPFALVAVQANLVFGPRVGAARDLATWAGRNPQRRPLPHRVRGPLRHRVSLVPGVL